MSIQAITKRRTPRPIPTLRDSDLQRFWAKVALPDESGCMNWLAATDIRGYGQFRIGGRATGRLYLAHRVAYVLAYGEHEPHLTLDHLCRNRACVNALHLEAVTSGENTRRAPREVWGSYHRSKTHCPAGHPYEPGNLYFRNGQWRRCRECVLASNARSARKRKEAEK